MENQQIAKILAEVKEAISANSEFESGNSMEIKAACISKTSIFWPLIALLSVAGLDACSATGNKLIFCHFAESNVSKESAIQVLDRQIASLTA